MKQSKRKRQPSEIEQAQRFIRAISNMTPDQALACEALMEDILAGRPTELSLAQYRKAVAS